MDSNFNSNNSANLFNTSTQYPGLENNFNSTYVYDKSEYYNSLSKYYININLMKYR